MHIGIMKEPSGETRVSLLPEAVASLIGKGHTILVETGAGTLAFASDRSILSIDQCRVESTILLEWKYGVFTGHAPENHARAKHGYLKFSSKYRRL